VTELGLGFFVFHGRRIAVDRECRTAALDLLTSKNWENPPRYFLSVATPGHKLWRNPGMIAPKVLREVIDAGLQSESVAVTTLASSSKYGPGFRSITFARDATRVPFSVTYGDRPQDGAKVDAWVDDVVSFFDLVSGSTGVVAAMGTLSEISSECSEGGVLRNGRLSHPFPEQHERMSGANRKHIGTRYMRFPRWGTLVSHAHVDELGGVDAITRPLQPAIVRHLSGGVYFQLTDSVATALSDEAAAKQRVFTEVAAKLLPPPVVPR
jgi:hypothetical protein